MSTERDLKNSSQASKTGPAQPANLRGLVALAWLCWFNPIRLIWFHWTSSAELVLVVRLQWSGCSGSVLVVQLHWSVALARLRWFGWWPPAAKHMALFSGRLNADPLEPSVMATQQFLMVVRTC